MVGFLSNVGCFDLDTSLVPGLSGRARVARFTDAIQVLPGCVVNRWAQLGGSKPRNTAGI